jgi:LysR family glycine cleavage system transcriptional activator
MLSADVAAGRIITPLPDITVRRTGYVALVPFDADKTSPLRTFIDWLVAMGNPSLL